jgi:spermidine synthase
MRVRVVAGIAALAAWVTILAAVPGASSEDSVIRYDRESRYYRIQVVDYPAKGRRCLHFSKSRGIQSSMILADPARLDLRYSQTMAAALALHPDPREVLLIGLGGASIPKFLQKYYPELELDIVELDPDVVRVCQDYFEFRGNAKTRVFVMDGRMYLKRAEKQYDLILLDAYAADHIPFHLTTVEFIQLVKSHLKPGGVVASNLWEKAINRFYLAELKTFQATFPQVYLLPAAQTGNIIVFGTMAEEPAIRKDWVLRAEAFVRGRDIGFDLPDLIGREYQCLTDRKIDEAVLTDDKAPVNTLRHEHPKHFEEEGASP